jgi:hypothetical protein
MPNLSQEDIRIRAYELWRAAGEPNGDNAGGFSAQEIKLSSCRSDNQAIFLGHKCGPRNEVTAQIQFDQNENLVAICAGTSGNGASFQSVRVA